MFQAIKPILAIIALVGLAMSIVVHVSALLGINAALRYPWAWGLHMGIFVVFIPAVYISRADVKRYGRPTFSELREGVPDWLVVLGAVLFFYAIANFIVAAAGTQGGQPVARAGGYVLESHGRFIREITADEYAALNTNVTRLFSGHWMVFYFMAYALLKYRKVPQ